MATFDLPLPDGWIHTQEDEKIIFFRELEREVTPGHSLYGVDIEIAGHREGTDDILVQYRQKPGRFTVVHLTWSNKPEIDALHPIIEYDGTYEGFLAYDRSWLQ